jgi:LysR family transcriptional regulator (chromosome initiation inhibitor)
MHLEIPRITGQDLPMNIDNDHLAAFAAALSEGTFDLAARKLNVTPSAISQRIKLLEERIGKILIQRTTPCKVTEAGRPLLRYAEELALLESEVLSELGVGDANNSSSFRVPIVVNADSLDSWFLDVFTALLDLPEITLDLRCEDQDHSVALLREGSVMAAVSARSEVIQGCRVELLGVMRFLALASPSYVDRYFASGVNAETLARALHMRFNRKDALQQAFIARLTDVALDPPKHYAPTTTSFDEAIQRGLAWGMVPEQLAISSLKTGQLVQIAPEHYLDVPLFFHRLRLGSVSLETVSKLVRQAARRSLR